MPKELLQMNQLEKFYSLIATNEARILITSQSGNLTSFHVYEGDEDPVKWFAISNDNSNNMIILRLYSWVERGDSSYYVGDSYYKRSTDLCSFKLGSEGYKLLTDLFHNLKKLDLFAYYDGKEFCNKTFSPFIEALRNLNSQKTTKGASTIDSTTAEPSGFKRLEEPTTEGVEHETQATGVTDSTTTELFQSEKPTTEKVEYEVQEDSKYFAVESDYLEEQEFDFTSNETTEEINYVMEEIKKLNVSHGITTENIMDVVLRSNNFTSKNVPAFSELSSTNATLPQLPN